MRQVASSLFATLQLALVGLGVPVAVFARLQDQLHPFQSIDAVLALGIALWLLLAKAAIASGDAVDSRRVNFLSPAWQAQRMVERSVFGVGFGASADDPSSAGLHLLAAAGQVTPDQLPPALIDVSGVDRSHEAERIRVGDDAVVHAIPVLNDLAPAMEPIQETQEYIVARGDTFWSISDVILGDGRLWKTLLEMNFGREVAPGVLLDEEDELRIGWSILLPVVHHEQDEELEVAPA